MTAECGREQDDPMVYTNGFRFAVQAVNEKEWTANVVSHPLDGNGGTVVGEDDTGSRIRFCGIVATPTD